MNITTPTESQIKAAAESSPEAKAALSKLFPEVFKPKLVEGEYREFNGMRKFFQEVLQETDAKLCFVTGDVLQSSKCKYNQKGIILSSGGWVRFKLVDTQSGYQILVPDLDTPIK